MTEMTEVEKRLLDFHESLKAVEMDWTRKEILTKKEPPYRNIMNDGRYIRDVPFLERIAAAIAEAQQDQSDPRPRLRWLKREFEELRAEPAADVYRRRDDPSGLNRAISAAAAVCKLPLYAKITNIDKIRSYLDYLIHRYEAGELAATAESLYRYVGKTKRELLLRQTKQRLADLQCATKEEVKKARKGLTEMIPTGEDRVRLYAVANPHIATWEIRLLNAEPGAPYTYDERTIRGQYERTLRWKLHEKDDILHVLQYMSGHARVKLIQMLGLPIRNPIPSPKKVEGACAAALQSPQHRARFEEHINVLLPSIRVEIERVVRMIDNAIHWSEGEYTPPSCPTEAPAIVPAPTRFIADTERRRAIRTAAGQRLEAGRWYVEAAPTQIAELETTTTKIPLFRISHGDKPDTVVAPGAKARVAHER